MISDALQDLVDIDAVLSCDRYAGDHQFMDKLFRGAKVIASYDEDGYQGQVARAYRLEQGPIVLASDYFGSCSGCDGWSGIDDEDAITYAKDVARNARLFPSVSKAIEWLRDPELSERYEFRVMRELVGQLEASNEE